MQAVKDSKMAKKPLSARAVEVMKPSDKDKSDTGENAGLRVSCGAAGTKSFFYRYTSPETGRLTQIKIGTYPTVSLAEARLELQQFKAIRKSGQCPKLLEQNKRQEIEQEELVQKQKDQAASFTVTDMVYLYLSHYIEDRKVGGKMVKGARAVKGQKETRRTLENDPVKVLGGLPASQVTRKDISGMVMAIVDRGANVQAGNVLRELTAAYEFSIGLDKFDDNFANPALQAKQGLKRANVKLTHTRGRRVLSDQELTKILRWLPGSGFSITQKNVIRLALWTGCRSGEVCAAEWRDVDLTKAVWHMRDSKNGAERYVQLPRQAVAFLQQLKLGTDTYLFQSTRTSVPIQQKTLTEIKWHLKNPGKVKNGKYFKPQQLWLSDIDDWSPHDLRRTVRTGLSRLGCPNEVAEAVLGHSRKGIEGTYDLHSYEPECRKWLQKWADYVDGLLAG